MARAAASADAGPVLDELLDRVRAGGGRITTARRAVLRALLEPPADHLGAEDVAARVQRRHPDIHLSTIYRTLEALEDLGLLTHVHLGHGPSTYHLTDRPHHHAVCRVCGRVVELAPDSFKELGRRLRSDHDFELDTQHFALAGRCRTCPA